MRDPIAAWLRHAAGCTHAAPCSPEGPASCPSGCELWDNVPRAARAELGNAARAVRLAAEKVRDQARQRAQDRRRAAWRERFRRAAAAAAAAAFDPWAELGIARDASRAEVKRAYRAAALRWHPDRGGSAEKMARVNRAWSILSRHAR